MSSSYEILSTDVSHDNVKDDTGKILRCVETVTFAFLRIEDGATLTVSVKRDPAPIDDADVIGGLRLALSLSLKALGAPMLEEVRFEPKTATAIN